MAQRPLIPTTLAATLLLAATWATAQHGPTPVPPTPTPVPFNAGPALHLLAGFEHQQARELLEPEQASKGATTAFETAWGVLRAQEGKLDEGLASLAAAASAAPNDPAPEYYRGEVLYWNKKVNDAKGAWQHAFDRAKALVAANPNDARAQYYLGAAAVRVQKYPEAHAALQAALANGFDPTLVGYQTGLCYAMEKKWQQVKDQLDPVIAADSGFAYAYLYRGLAWRELKHTDQMLLDLDRFLKLAPSLPEADLARSLLAAAGRH